MDLVEDIHDRIYCIDFRKMIAENNRRNQFNQKVIGRIFGEVIILKITDLYVNYTAAASVERNISFEFGRKNRYADRGEWRGSRRPTRSSDLQKRKKGSINLDGENF